MRDFSQMSREGFRFAILTDEYNRPAVLQLRAETAMVRARSFATPLPNPATVPPAAL